MSEPNQSTIALSNLYKSIRKLDQNDTLNQKDDVPEEEKPEQTADASITKAPPSPEIQVSPHRIAKTHQTEACYDLKLQVIMTL